MATVTRENIGLLHDKITITVTPEDYGKAYKKSLAKAAESANIPGFRKGKVPPQVVNKMYGEKIIGDEVIKTTEKEIVAYLEKEQIVTISQPIPVSNTFTNIDIKNLKEYDFVFEIGIRPTVSINPENIKVTRYVIEVSDKMIDEQIQTMQFQGGTMTEPETVSSDDDTLNVTFEEVDAEGSIIEGGINKPINIHIKQFEAEFRKTLFGLKKEDHVLSTIEVAFDDTERKNILDTLGLNNDEAEILNKNFKITINNIGLQVKAELNEEFFKKMFPFKEITTEADFRDAVKEEISVYFAEQSRRQMHDQIYHFLIDETKIDLPKDFLIKMLEIGDEKRRTKAEAEEVYPSFESQFKWSLISSYLQNEGNIKVFPEDFKNLAKTQVFQQLGGQLEMFGGESFLDDFAERMIKDKKFIDENYGRIFADKIFTYIEDKVSATEESIDFETFSSKQHHHHY